jgi:hypothetical protein
MGINNQYNYYNSSEEHEGMNFRKFPKFNSVKDAAKYANIGTSAMIARLKGRTKITTYKYYENGL